MNKKSELEKEDMAKINLETVRGMRDFLPEDELLRQELLEKIKKVLETYGFSPWNAPVLEYEALLKEKSVESKLIFKFKDQGGRDVVMRPEKTPSLARIIGSNPNLPKPLKLYNIDRVWRYDRPQRGRYREFTQCDIDIIGVANSMADAELLACTSAVLRAIGLEKFTFRINSRALMNELLENAGVSKKQVKRTLRIIDKIDKIGADEVAKELRKLLSSESVNDLMTLMKARGSWYTISKAIKICDDTRETIEKFLVCLEDFGIKNFVFDLSLVRGLDYYTGLVFEVDAGEDIGSVAGGGRYDKLIGVYSGQDVPATGLAIGFERLLEVLKAEKVKTKTKVYIIPIKTTEKAIEIAEKFRKAGINTDLDLAGRDLRKNLDYANKMEIPFVVFVGEKELSQGKIKLRNMQNGSEDLLKVDEAIETLKRH
jgi:histidyl-tRNA synthetase